MVGRPPAWRSLWTSTAASRGGCTLTILSIFSSVLSVKLIISKKGGKGQGNRDAPYNIIMFTITITIIIAGRKRGDGNAALHIRSNVGLSKRSHSFTLNPRETGAHCSILAHIYYFFLFPDLHLQNVQPADRAGCGRLGLDFGRQCASLHRPRVNLRTHQLTAGDLSQDFLLFWEWFRFFFKFWESVVFYFIYRLLSQWVQK